MHLGNYSVLFNYPKLLTARKAYLFNANILLVMLYGYASWNTMILEESKLQVTQRAMERFIMGINRLQYITSDELWGRSACTYNRKRKWAGHTVKVREN